MKYLKLLVGGLVVAYFAIGVGLGLYSIIYDRLVTCTSDGWVGFFWCPATSNRFYEAPIGILLWPLYLG